MPKNILSDTDYTKGTDNRFKNGIVIAKVAKLEVSEKGANIRALLADKVDHKGTPLVTKPVPVLQTSSGGKKSFTMPRVGQNVVLIKLPNGTGNYLPVGYFYTKNDPPPVTDPKLDYCIYDDGSIKQFDANSGTETNKFKGDTIWEHEGGMTATLKKAVSFKTDGDFTIEAPNIILKGFVDHTGNMRTSGIHNAQDGPHAACGAGERLEQANIAQRISTLEATIMALNARLGELERGSLR